MIVMVENAEIQELYSIIFDVLNGFNKTHDVQVLSVDFEASVPTELYQGSVICREYQKSIIDYHYRDLVDADYDWYSPNWSYLDQQRTIDRINSGRRRKTQQHYRAGRDIRTLWWTKHSLEAFGGCDCVCL